MSLLDRANGFIREEKNVLEKYQNKTFIKALSQNKQH